MSRLETRSKKRSVVETLSTDTEDLSKFVKVTFTMRKRDIEELERYVKKMNEEEIDENVTKSLVVRKALKHLYSSKKAFSKIG